MSNRTIIESQVRAIQTQLKLLWSLLQQEAARLSQQHASGLDETRRTTELAEIEYLREAQQQIQVFEAQMQTLHDRLQQAGSAETQPQTLRELRGMLKGKVHTTEAQIREAQIRWEWDEECSPDE